MPASFLLCNLVSKVLFSYRLRYHSLGSGRSLGHDLTKNLTSIVLIGVLLAVGLGALTGSLPSPFLLPGGVLGLLAGLWVVRYIPGFVFAAYLAIPF
jgi:hypothetical protein